MLSLAGNAAIAAVAAAAGIAASYTANRLLGLQVNPIVIFAIPIAVAMGILVR